MLIFKTTNVHLFDTKYFSQPMFYTTVFKCQKYVTWHSPKARLFNKIKLIFIYIRDGFQSHQLQLNTKPLPTPLKSQSSGRNLFNKIMEGIIGTTKKTAKYIPLLSIIILLRSRHRVRRCSDCLVPLAGHPARQSARPPRGFLPPEPSQPHEPARHCSRVCYRHILPGKKILLIFEL